MERRKGAYGGVWYSDRLAANSASQRMVRGWCCGASMHHHAVSGLPKSSAEMFQACPEGVEPPMHRGAKASAPKPRDDARPQTSRLESFGFQEGIPVSLVRDSCTPQCTRRDRVSGPWDEWTRSEVPLICFRKSTISAPLVSGWSCTLAGRAKAADGYRNPGRAALGRIRECQLCQEEKFGPSTEPTRSGEDEQYRRWRPGWGGGFVWEAWQY